MSPNKARLPKNAQSRWQEDWEDSSNESFPAFTPEQAKAWRSLNPVMSVWRVLGFQALTGLAVTLVAAVLTGSWNSASCVAYGAACVLLPSALLARGMSSPVTAINAQTAVLGLFVWELVKIALTVAMLFGATRVLKDLSWPALLVGLVLTMKVNWVVLAWQQVRQSKAKVRTD
ncbi:MAG: ATP synthase subunit I [Betaproteobacteria bacterium]|jgi:ATP synthase protein I|nr:ATP synthase subunit I [Burkholderiales bacterium]NBX14647.1 ATP synthase subunit I [Betaproteobacteria bacterium]NBX89444.1 ATP synthase subunit I [Betaproteobacteria bacterium]